MKKSEQRKAEIQWLRQLSKTNPIQALDQALRAIERATSPEHGTALQRQLESQLNQRFGPAETMFSSRDARVEETLLSCLLRLLRAANHPFEPAFRMQITKFFDRVLAGKKGLYANLGITSTHQTHEKLDQLRSCAESIHNRIVSLPDSLTTLDSLQGFNNQLRRTLGGIQGRSIIGPFISANLKESMNAAVNAARDYSRSESASRPFTAANVTRITQTLSQLANQENTIYSTTLSHKLAKQVQRIVADDFRNRPESKPAKLSIRETPKKYPLRQGKSAITLRVEVLNTGKGPALGTQVLLETIDNVVSIQNSSVNLGFLAPGITVVEFIVTLEKPTTELDALFRFYWNNTDGTSHDLETILCFKGQSSTVNWSQRRHDEPYELEPVVSDTNLVGRSRILTALSSAAVKPNIGSSFIYGQKRVGKTSIGRSLQSILKGQTFGSRVPPNTLYIDAGDYIDTTPQRTIENLGTLICREIAASDQRLSTLAIPQFKEALSPLTTFLRQVERTAPDFRMLFILDEFDELPISLYRRGEIGDALFLTVRSISAKPQFGFVLIGGEKMEYLISCQGDALNKFDAHLVDYFHRETQLQDFRNLITIPTANVLEFTEDAQNMLHSVTAGHPYFAKLICREVFRRAVDSRDSHVTVVEVEHAIHQTAETLPSTSFQHFWEDGIAESGPAAELVSVDRRRVLVGLGETLRGGRAPTENSLREHAMTHRLSIPLHNLIRDFVRRRVLLEHDRGYTLKVPLFERWLRETGATSLVTTLTDVDGVAELSEQETAAKVTPAEVAEVRKNWRYRGAPVTSESVRAWLSQFGSNRKQRAVFELLKRLQFVSESEARSRLRSLHNTISRELGVLELTSEQRKYSHIAVAYLDKPGKSGAAYARLYANENRIYMNCVIDRQESLQAARGETGHSALVFVDDFIGTGNSIIQYLSEFFSERKNTNQESAPNIFVAVTTGFSQGISAIEDFISSEDLPVTLFVAHTTGAESRAFADPSMFSSDETAAIALAEAKRFGESIEPKNPLGFGNIQSLVVFEDGCPNNTLPILWQRGKKWTPLFPRH